MSRVVNGKDPSSLFEKVITLRPSLNYTNVTARGKPTLVMRGATAGFSLPIYNSDNEELYFKVTTPKRWDCVTDPIMKVLCYLSSAETANDDFQLQLSVGKVTPNGVVGDSVTDIEVETNIPDAYKAQYTAYSVEFTIDASALDLDYGDAITGRLRRIAAEGTEIEGEIVIVDWRIEFKTNKVFGDLS